MTSRWYVVCQFTGTARVDGEYRPIPASVAHAKAMGGTLTACGENAITWTRLFHISFPPAKGDVCPACFEAVTKVRVRRT